MWIAIAVMMHAVQVMWAVIGWTVPFFWKAPAKPVEDAPVGSGLRPREPA